MYIAPGIFHIISIVLLLGVSTAAVCQTEDPEDDPLNCDVDVEILLDKSASMIRNRIWRPVTGSIKTVVRQAPLNTWGMGLVTFPDRSNHARPDYSLRTFSSRNVKDDLISAIDRVIPDLTFTEIIQNAYQASAELLNGRYDAHKVMVVISDGLICGENGCDDEYSAADYIKSAYGHTIITIGYKLDRDSKEVMKKFASSNDRGQPLYFDSQDVRQIREIIEREIPRACIFRPAKLQVSPNTSTLVLSDRNRTTHSVKLKYIDGPSRNYRFTYQIQREFESNYTWDPRDFGVVVADTGQDLSGLEKEIGPDRESQIFNIDLYNNNENLSITPGVYTLQIKASTRGVVLKRSIAITVVKSLP